MIFTATEHRVLVFSVRHWLILTVPFRYTSKCTLGEEKDLAEEAFIPYWKLKAVHFHKLVVAWVVVNITKHLKCLHLVNLHCTAFLIAISLTLHNTTAVFWKDPYKPCIFTALKSVQIKYSMVLYCSLWQCPFPKCKRGDEINLFFWVMNVCIVVNWDPWFVKHHFGMCVSSLSFSIVFKHKRCLLFIFVFRT